jgi:hypothetical protein
MPNAPLHDQTPEGRTSPATRIIGTLVIVALVIAVILLALGVVRFDPSNWWG